MAVSSSKPPSGRAAPFPALNSTPPLPRDSTHASRSVQDYHVAPSAEHHHYNPTDAGPRLHEMSPAELAADPRLFSADYADLAFNQRVLQMALDTETPLLERMKFLCIVASNLDEVYSKRLGNLPILTDDEGSKSSSQLYKQTVRPRSSYEEDLAEAVRLLVDTQYEVLLQEVLPALSVHGIQILTHRQLDAEQTADMRAFFRKNLAPLITPLSVDQTHPFPTLHSHAIYLQVVLLNPESLVTRSVYFRVPDERRLVKVGPSGLLFLPVEEICLHNLDLVCEGMELIKAHPFRVTRNVKLDMDDTQFGEDDTLLDFVWEEVHRRRTAPATRLEIGPHMPNDVKTQIMRELMLDPSDVFRMPCDLLGLAGFFDVGFAPKSELQYPENKQIVPKPFARVEEKLAEDPGKIFSEIRKTDILIDYPTHSFASSALLFLRAAARDPQVVAIKCVIYRGGSDSPLVAALTRAAKYGKEVSVLVELKASFDEVTNSEYAQTLRDAGCNVSHGLMGLKTHSKIMLVVRKEESDLRLYCNIATGNFNAKTAKLYTDLALFTCRPDICKDVADLFNALFGYSRKRHYARLLVAPVTMLDMFIGLIKNEIKTAESGGDAHIAVQINGLTCPEIIEALYEASAAGVRIDLIVRGICGIRPGIPGKSDTIRVFSWIGEFLQHRRIFYFSDGGRGKYFIGSADWRTRNLQERVEVITPIDDKKLRKKLWRALMFFIKDNRATWEMGTDGRYYKLKASAVDISPSWTGTTSGSSPLPTLTLPNGKAGGFALVDADDEQVPVLNSEAAKEWDRTTTEISRGTFGSPTINSAIQATSARDVDRQNPTKYTEVEIGGQRVPVIKLLAGCVPYRTPENSKPTSTPEFLLITDAISGSFGSRNNGGARQEEAYPVSAVWSLPKGGVVNGEEFQAAAKREAEEESGITGTIQTHLGWFLAGKNNDKALNLFALEVTGEMEWAEEYLRDRRWLPAEEAIQLVSGPGSRSPKYVADGLRKALTWYKFKQKGSRSESSKVTK